MQTFVDVCVFEQRSRVIVAVQAGLAGPGSHRGGYLIIIVLAWRVQPPSVDVDRDIFYPLTELKKQFNYTLASTC